MKALPLALVLLLSACSSGQGVSPVAKAVVGKLTSVVGIGEEAPPAEPPKVLTRARIEESGLAMIRARVGEGTSAQLLTAQTDNGGFVNFASQLRQSLTLRGALVTATRGIERDLLSTRVFPGDPIAFQAPVSKWPKAAHRIYYLPGNDPQGDPVEVTCTFLFGDKGEHTIVERTYPVIQVLESCQGDGVGFENAHLVDTRDGTVWRSRQWIGFQSSPVYFDVLEPYTP